MTTPLSSHGTIVAVQFTPGGVFTDISEQGDITFPSMTRNAFDATTQTRQIDSWILGVIRRSPATVKMNMVPNDTTMDNIAGLGFLFKNNTITGWRFTIPILPVPTTSVWVGSGQVKGWPENFVAPVDGKLAADVSIQFSGIMTIDGVQFG